MNKRILCTMLVLAMIATAFLPYIPMASAVPNPPAGGGNWNGDWTVTDTVSYNPGVMIQMMTGNIHVTNTGDLTLNNAAIIFHPGVNGAKGIQVDAGGKFTMTNAAVMTSAGGFTYYVKFLKDSTIKVDHSTIANPGGPSNQPPNSGIYVGTKNATIENAVFGNNAAFAELMYLDAPMTIRNNTFLGFHDYDLVANANVTLYDNIFDTLAPANQNHGVKINPSVNVTAVNNKFQNLNGNGFVLDDYSGLVARLNKIQNITGTGIASGFKNKITLVQNDIFDDGNGIGAGMGSTVKMTKTNRLINMKHDGIDVTSDAKVDSTDTYIKNSANANIYENLGSINFSKGTLIQATGNYQVELTSNSKGNIDSTAITGKTNVDLIMTTDGSLLDIKKCAIDGPANMFGAIAAGNNADVTVENSTMATVGNPLFASNGHIYSRNNTFANVGIPFFGFGFGSITSDNDAGASNLAQTAIGEAMDSANIKITHANIKLTGANTVIAFAGTDGTVEMYDSAIVMNNPFVDYAAGDHGHILVINSSGTPGNTGVGGDGTIDFGWHTEVLTQWQNGAVAPNANVAFNDSKGVIMNKLTTDVNGKADVDVISATDYTPDDGNTIITNYHNFYNITGTLNGMTGLTNLNISDNKLGAQAILVKIKDTSKPFINITYPVNNFLTNKTNISFGGSVSDTGSGIAKVEGRFGNGSWFPVEFKKGLHQVNGVDLSGDEMDYQARATDLAGNVATASVHFTIDQTPPLVTIDEPVGLYIKSHKFWVNGTIEPNANGTMKCDIADRGYIAGKYGIELDGIMDGTHIITVDAMDRAGNHNILTKTVIVDTVPPTLTVDIKNGAFTIQSNLPLTGKSDGNFVTVNGANATVDLMNKTWRSPQTLTEGANKFTVVATDLAGNTNFTTVTVILDTIKPIIKMTSPIRKIYTNKASWVFSGQVIEANLDYLQIDGKNVTVDANGNFSVMVPLEDGTNNIMVEAKDKAKQTAQSPQMLQMCLQQLTVVITSPKEGLVTNVKDQDITVHVTARNPSSNFTYRLNIGNGGTTIYRPVNLTSVTLGPGSNTIEVNVTDQFGNIGLARLNVTYDDQALLTLTKPTKSSVSTTKNTVTIQGKSEKGATIHINGQSIPVDPDNTFSYDLLVKEGKTSVTVKAVDPAGNEKSSSFTVNYTNPKQYDLGMLLGLAIVLMIIGLIIGLVVGMVMGRRKAKPPTEEEPISPKAPTKPAYKEEAAFTPEEEPEEPAPKAPLKDKQGVSEAPSSVTEPKTAPPKPEPKAEPKPEPKPEPKVEPKAAPKPTSNVDSSLDELLKNLDKK